MVVLIFSIMLFTLSNLGQCSEVLKPRGVPLTKAPLYAPGQTFTCLDGSGSIPYTYINDDYCDCRDGSDEPGTSACPNGVFHCSNVGHMALDLRSSRVNDGVCDCCDASDEWASGAECTDVCMELGRAAREEAQRREEEVKQGYNLKLGMIEQGKNIRQEKENKVMQLKHELEEAEAVKRERESQKTAAEEPEAAALEQYKEAEEARKEAEKKIKEEANRAEAEDVFLSLDSDADGLLTQAELQQDTTYDTNRDGTVSDDEASFYLQQSESVDFEKFYTGSWRLMRPAFNFAKRKNSGDATPAPLFTPPVTEDPSAAAEGMLPLEEREDTSDSQTEMPPLEEPLDENGDAVDDGLEYPDDGDDDLEEEDEPVDDSAAVPEVVYDEQTQALVDAANAARAAFQEAAEQVKQINDEIVKEEEALNKDYGEEDEYRVLEGTCFEYTDREYTYKLCPFDKATQAPKNGGGETRLGSWSEWMQENGANSYTAMKYTNGQGCWNGPNRSTLVKLQCGVESKLTSATEPSKCEYEFTFSTPAACQRDDAQAEEYRHTEL